MMDTMVGSDLQMAADDVPAVKVRGYWRSVAYRLRYDYVTLVFAAVILLIALAAIFAPLLAPADPLKTSMAYRLKPIGFGNFVLGTDELGRDMLSRLTYGGRMSLLMGLTPVVLATTLGGALGILAPLPPPRLIGDVAVSAMRQSGGMKTRVKAIRPLVMPPPIVPEMATASSTEGKA